MAKHLVLVVERGHLVPANPFSAEIIDTLKLDKEYSVEIKEVRRPGQLNLYWAGIGLLINNLDEANHAKWPTSRHYSDAMLIAFGFTYKLWRIDGSYREVPESIALDRMDAETFEQFFEGVRAATVSLFGFDPWDLWIEEKGGSWRDNRRNWRQGDTD